ncbi:hypothetical protein [Aquabacterium sp.]|uniref:hypothetical protein n=1 Tax=Aquabacterium sp. TaxID=1872578 RepID=UPI0025C3FFA4|nr:hypothetical protein [Aquabacterium sp.]
MTKAKFSEILDGYEFCAFGDLMDTQAFLSLERGTVHIVSGDMELDEEPPEDIDGGPYLSLPDKSELKLGKNLAIEFAEEHLPNDLSTVLGFFHKSCAYGNFKALLERKGQLEAWFAYEKAAKESRLRQWCAENDIELI